MIKIPAQPGIAIAPILMLLALIAVLISALAAGSSSFGTSAMGQDRVIYELRGQIDLIRSKIEECVQLTRQPGTALYTQFFYPGYNQIDTSIPMASLTCPKDPTGQTSLWMGARPTTLPAAPSGFANWVYINHGNPDDPSVSVGGICFYTKLNVASANTPAIQAAISTVLKKFSTLEYTYNPADSFQTLIIWIKRPNSGTTC